MITINMGKARDIKRDRIRDERKPLFEQLDVLFMKAIESGDDEKKAEIVQLKNALRDAPADNSIDSVLTIDDLKQLSVSAIQQARDYIISNN